MANAMPSVAVGQETNGPMIDKREILEAASSFSLLPNVVEKDYVLGWILAGIYAHEELAESWVFKGGTCLKKCYFETYRFSEHLDFTLRSEEQLGVAKPSFIGLRKGCP
jgi:predicted nucleotidyltransferase component of viral defense system